MKPHAQAFHMAYQSAVSWDVTDAAPVGGTINDMENRSSVNNSGTAAAKPGHDREQSVKPQTVKV